MLSFKPTFSLSSFTFVNRLFSSSSLSAMRVVSSAYLRLLIFLLAISIPACASSNPAFHMMYSACELNRMAIYILDVFLCQFGINLLFHVRFCFFLTCIQVSQEAGKVVWYSHLFKKFSQFVVIHTVKGFGVVKLGIKPGSPTLWADSLPSEPPGKPLKHSRYLKMERMNKLDKVENL